MINNLHEQRILILDFGSQYSQLIARRLRELGVYCELHPYDMLEQAIIDFAPKGIILSGGPESVTENETARAPQIVFELNVPVLGICYGMQVMAMQLGGEVECSNRQEFGNATLYISHNHTTLLEGVGEVVNDRGLDYLNLPNGTKALSVWMSHGDHVTKLPQSFTCSAKTQSVPIAAMSDVKRHFYGLQFHPEVTHTKKGHLILERFVKNICGCEGLWTTTNIISEIVQDVRAKISKHEKVLLGLSGGVDSAVTAALLHKAIGDQLVCVFVDNGLLRYKEAEQVEKTFVEHFGMNVISINAADQFLSALKSAHDPEQKRKIIGKEFIEVFQKQAQQLSEINWLAQGTIYPDVIESAKAISGKAHVIKSHHNVGGLPETLHLKLLEPLRDLFKDEVRKIGLELGLPYDMIYRHPFPGPGLAVRVLGEIKLEYIHILRQADHIFMQELQNEGLYHAVQQAFAVFMPVKSVAVKGDARFYEYVIALRAVETIDFMTANCAELPLSFLMRVANRICNEIREVSRVVYDITSKPPATIEWE